MPTSSHLNMNHPSFDQIKIYVDERASHSIEKKRKETLSTRREPQGWRFVLGCSMSRVEVSVWDGLKLQVSLDKSIS